MSVRKNHMTPPFLTLLAIDFDRYEQALACLRH